MRARMKRRQRIKRLTILATLIIIIASLVLGIYFVSLASAPSGIDKMDGVAVSSTDLSTLYRLSLQPYGPAPTSSISGTVKSYSGTPFTSSGKPIVVYIGAEFCEYCAVTRWGLILALMRFGNFTGLEYMTSSAADFDLPTFTFVASHYTSQYLAFQPFEYEDRSGAALTSVPSNYTTIWQAENGGSFPFIDFGNQYVATSSILSVPTILQNKNWTQIYSEVSTGDSTGLEIKESANLITGVICKLTNGAPGSICGASSINTVTSSLASPTSASLAFDSPGPAWATPQKLEVRLSTSGFD